MEAKNPGILQKQGYFALAMDILILLGHSWDVSELTHLLQIQNFYIICFKYTDFAILLT